MKAVTGLYRWRGSLGIQTREALASHLTPLVDRNHGALLSHNVYARGKGKLRDLLGPKCIMLSRN